MFIVYSISIILLLILGINVLYFFIFSIAALFPRRSYRAELKKYNRFAVMIPAYREGDVVVASVQHAFLQDYPRDKYEIIVICDQLISYSVGELKLHPVHVIEVAFENSTKAQSLNAALDAIQRDAFDYVVVLDIDNHMEPSFLSLMNSRLQQNEAALQGHRTAKNLDSPFAVLDAISEEVNNTIFREGHDRLNLSAALIGSAMAIRIDIFTSIMRKIKAIGGFDKELELRLIAKGYRIGYASDAIVYDEKVGAHGFKNQRTRWLQAQLKYFSLYFVSGVVKAVTQLRFDYFDKVFQLALLSRVIVICALFVLACTYFLGFEFHIYFIWLFLINAVTMLLAMPKQFYNLNTLRAIAHLPKAVGLMMLALFNVKKAKKKFIHTRHHV